LILSKLFTSFYVHSTWVTTLSLSHAVFEEATFFFSKE
jgi:hypothetical protein